MMHCFAQDFGLIQRFSDPFNYTLTQSFSPSATPNRDLLMSIWRELKGLRIAISLGSAERG